MIRSPMTQRFSIFALAEQLFCQVNADLASEGLSLPGETIIDATLIAAPSSTKNRSGQRDEQMHQTKKGNQWYFGTKRHIGVDDASGLVHHVHCTAANLADVTQINRLLCGEEDSLCGDSDYPGTDKRKEMQQIKAVVLIALRPSRVRAIKNSGERCVAAWRQIVIARLRAKVEHPFGLIKWQFGYSKVCY